MRTLVIVALLARAVRADEFATSPVRAGYAAAQERLLDSARRSALEDAGWRLDGTYAFETFVAPQLDDRVVSAGLFMIESELDASKLVHRALGSAHVAAFAIHGKGLTEELRDVHGVSGNAAPPDVRLFEAWYEQPLGVVAVRAGLLAADQEFVLADRSSTLLSATFGITSQFSSNVLGPVYPIASPGVSGRLELDAVVVRAAIYDGTQRNERGIPTQLGPDHLLIGEVQLAELLELGAWRHDERGTAIYAIADGQLDRHVGAFARVGVSPGEAVSTYIDAGIRIGPGPLRPDDFLCAGLAFARTEQGAETLIEASYEAQIRWLTVQPDVQVVMMHDRTVAVFATRATVVF